MVTDISVIAAFGAGVLSFLSPCVLPLVPAYLCFISGLSLGQMRTVSTDVRVLLKVGTNCLMFVLGFSIVFVALGATATVVGQFLLSHLALLSKIAGLIIVILGLHTLGWLRIGFLNYEKRFQSRGVPAGNIGAFVVGLAFAFGWTPCVGPILATILAYAGTQQTVGKGVLLLSSYSLGLGIPFVASGVGINAFLRLFKRMKAHLRIVETISGLVLVVVGLLMFLGVFSSAMGIFR
ncbi:MAG: cytochrome c biogenesis protein CcdA [Candidatus Latescibacteria bacterium]|nr:cytochrome c biogenesis protein CcdA [Candidatus Latescibacterota bacterium]